MLEFYIMQIEGNLIAFCYGYIKVLSAVKARFPSSVRWWVVLGVVVGVSVDGGSVTSDSQSKQDAKTSCTVRKNELKKKRMTKKKLILW